MDQLSVQHLRTKRLNLRELRPEDWREISFLRSDPEVNEFVKRKPARTKEEALKFIKKINDNFGTKGYYYWCITLPPSNQIIGTICLWKFSKDGAIAELGYDLHPSYHKKGFMDEAMKSVVNYAFHHLLVENIEAFTHVQNIASRKLLERNSFTIATARVDESNLNNCIYELRNKL
jgi:ribosomal-protein-alanine N-acetyltransferase